MLTPDVRVEGFDSGEWARLSDVFRAVAEVDPEASRGGIVAVTSGPRLRKLISTVSGRLDPASEPWPEPLSSLCRRHRARWAAELAFGALDELGERFADRIRPGQDLLTQALEMIAVLRELEAEGQIVAHPMRMADWPVPHEHVVLSVLDALCPRGKAIAIAVFEDCELSTCLVARRGERGFDLLLGPSELRREVGFLSGDHRRDYRLIGGAIERRVAPLALGCYGELSTFRRLARGEVLGGWASAVAARDVVLSPAPVALAVPLGLDLGRVAFSGFRSLAERSGFGSLLDDLGQRFGRSPALLAIERDVAGWLGFDPLKLLGQLLAR